jgi:hypothetical protein
MESDLLAVIHNQSIGSLYKENRNRHGINRILQQSIHGAAKIFGVGNMSIWKQFACS